jgi:predicted SnoaL-like aldol condensation-catalyzing enzyme
MKIKDIAVKFLQLVVAGNIDEAYEMFVDMKGKHHNIYFPADFYSLKDAMKENHKEFPNKVFEIKNIIAEGNLVAAHSSINIGEKKIAVVHLFRFENEKIIEMWDVGQEIPDDIPNIDGAF